MVPRTRAPGAGVALACSAVCLAVLGVLGVGVLAEFGPQLRLDAAVSEALYAGDGRAATLDGFLEVLTALGLSTVRLVAFVPVLVLLARRRVWRTLAWVSVAIVLIGPLTTLLKELFGRIRPSFEAGGARYESLSFPSGHSAGIATGITVALLLAWPLLSRVARRWAVVVGVALVVLVGLTRIWLGVHYLSDVVGGWALGIGWTLLTALLLGVLPDGRAAPRTAA